MATVRHALRPSALAGLSGGGPEAAAAGPWAKLSPDGSVYAVVVLTAGSASRQRAAAPPVPPSVASSCTASGCPRRPAP